MASRLPLAHRKALSNTAGTGYAGAIVTLAEPGYRLAQTMGVDADPGERMARPDRRSLHERGQAVLEFALGLPLLLTLITGLVMFGVAFNNDLTLTYATEAAAQLLSISRGQTSDPCATTSSAFYSAAPYLTASSLGFTIVLGGQKYTGTSCASAQLVESETAQVTVTYPCSLGIFGFGVSNFSLTAQTTALIQ